MFKLDTKKITVLGEELEVRPVPVSEMLKFRETYKKIEDDDMAGLVKLMADTVKACVIKPIIKDADMAVLDSNSLQTLFKQVSEAAGLISEKKEGGNGTTS